MTAIRACNRWIIFVLSFSIGVGGQDEICSFYGLFANCRYRIDGISLSQITANIDQCSDPVSVTFDIVNERPPVNIRHTFSTSDSLIMVHGFTVEVKLRVRLRPKKDDIINVEADFMVYNQDKVDFINSDIDLKGQFDQCPSLNEAAKITISVTAILAVLAIIMLVILLVIRRRRLQQNTSERMQNVLVNNVEEQGTLTPATSLTNI